MAPRLIAVSSRAAKQKLPGDLGLRAHRLGRTGALVPVDLPESPTAANIPRTEPSPGLSGTAESLSVLNGWSSPRAFNPAPCLVLVLKVRFIHVGSSCQPWRLA